MSSAEACPAPSVSESIDMMDANQSSSNVSSSYQTAQKAVDKSVAKLTSKTKIFPHVKEHLQPIYRNDSKNVLEIFKSMMNQLDTMIKEEFHYLFDSSNLEQLLNELDSVKQECRTPKMWRPSGIPEQDVKAHLQESAVTELEHLEKIHTALMSKNKWLNEIVQRTSSKAASSVKLIDDSWQGWENAASVVTQSTREEITNITNSFPEVNFIEEAG